MRKKLYAAAVTIGIITFILPATVSAATASFSLNGQSATISQNDTFSVQVLVSGTNINGVTAKLNYDQSKLTCLGVNTATSTFAAGAGANCSNGTVTISRYIGINESTGQPNPAKNGTQVVGNVNFRALAGSGSAAVGFAPGSQIASNGVNIWDQNTAGRTYNFSTQAVINSPETTDTSAETSGQSTSIRRPSANTSGNVTGNENTQPAVLAEADESGETGSDETASEQLEQSNAQVLNANANAKAVESAGRKWQYIILPLGLAILIGVVYVINKPELRSKIASSK